MKVKNIQFLIYLFVFAGFAINSLIAQDSTNVKNENQEKVQTQHGTNFIDKDGDGFNDNAPDHDGDGIPNGLDPDYKGPGKEKKKKFVDLDGDGIDDSIYEDETMDDTKSIGPKNKSTSVQPGGTKQNMKKKRTGKK